MNDIEKDKILILSATFGDGHKQVAKAISEAVEYTLPNASPIILDIMEWIHPYLYPVSLFVYKGGIKRFPQVYSYFYKKTRVKNSFSTKLNSLFTFGLQTMLEVIQRINPRVVVSTYPFAAGIISKLKEQGLINIPAITIITDYTDHSYWIHPYTDLYIVGSNQVRDRLISLGIEDDKIKNTGIPVRQRFIESQPRELLLEKYGMNSNKFTVLLMGGGDGFIGKGRSTFRALESVSQTLQLIIVCGRNKRLKKQLELELKDYKHDVLLLGFCENIQELMAISDLMITKPGGVTTSEALAMGLPLLIYHPLPGQEEDNAEFLWKSGLAFLAKTENDLILKIESILNDSRDLKSMQLMTEPYQTRTSSFDALNVIVQALNFEQKQGIC
jgi:processive 1,2-diacylglycerol beta-glucosyltransferase